MSLSDFSSIGSFISGLGILISLVYLSIQVRHNTASFQRAEANATVEQNSLWRSALYSNRDVARLWVEGRKDDSTLDEVDEVRFLATVADHFWRARHAWDRNRRGLMEKGSWERASRPALIRTLMTKRGAQWWETNKSIS